MAENGQGSRRNRLSRWFHRTFDDWFFRALIGPAQVQGAVHGAEREAREQWKRDLANRKRFSAAQRELKRRAR